MGNCVFTSGIVRKEETFTAVWGDNSLTLPYKGLKCVNQYRDNLGCHYYFVYNNTTSILSCYRGRYYGPFNHLQNELQTMCVGLEIPFNRTKL